MNLDYLMLLAFLAGCIITIYDNFEDIYYVSKADIIFEVFYMTGMSFLILLVLLKLINVL